MDDKPSYGRGATGDNDNLYLVLYCLILATVGLLLNKLEPMQWVGLTGPHATYLLRNPRMLR